MSLSIVVGILAELGDAEPEAVENFKRSFSRMNEILAAQGLPQHHEPLALPPLDSRCRVESYPYSFLLNLRRAYAYAAANPEWSATPVAAGYKVSDDPVLKEQSRKMNSHLLSHSITSGFYLPIDFTPVLHDVRTRAAGGLIGSSFQLRRELVLVAPALGITLSGIALADSEAESINKDFEKDGGMEIERLAWLSLYEAARLSIQHRAAICFA